eukprot:469812-Pelagomonas_calceolata.AAC.1
MHADEQLECTASPPAWHWLIRPSEGPMVKATKDLSCSYKQRKGQLLLPEQLDIHSSYSFFWLIPWLEPDRHNTLPHFGLPHQSREWPLPQGLMALAGHTHKGVFFKDGIGSLQHWLCQSLSRHNLFEILGPTTNCSCQNEGLGSNLATSSISHDTVSLPVMRRIHVATHVNWVHLWRYGEHVHAVQLARVKLVWGHPFHSLCVRGC